MKALIRPLGALIMCLAAVTASAQNFYDARFLSGVTDFNRGAYARAADELRVAAFGRVDDVAAYEAAEIYLALANDKIDRAEDARQAALKVTQAERLHPVYARVSLPPDVRTAFEALLPTLLTREQLAHAPAFAPAASQAPVVQSDAPRLTARPRPQVPTPTKEPNVAVTVRKNDVKVEAPQNLDYGRLALEHVATGDEAGGSRYAGLALADDDTNVNAHTALAQIAYAHAAWSDVAEHYAVVRTNRRLTDDEAAAYFIALTKINRKADALGVSRGLSPSVLSRSDVREALRTLESSSAPQTVAPQPRVMPQPQLVAPQPVQPSPDPQPTVTSRAPAPQPSARQQQVQPQPTPPQPRVMQQAAPMPVSPAPQQTAAAPPPSAPVGASVDAPAISMQISAAETMLTQNNVVGARSELRRIATLPNLERPERLLLAKAMSQTALYAESSAQYRKAYPLKPGEEPHMFYEAVNRYQIGDYDLARQLMTRAMPALPQTPAILAYRDRILAQH